LIPCFLFYDTTDTILDGWLFWVVRLVVVVVDRDDFFHHQILLVSLDSSSKARNVWFGRAARGLGGATEVLQY
jgi:hypothetical protein